MADTMKLKSNGSEVSFSPLPGYVNPAAYRRSQHEALDGTFYIYQWGMKNSHEISVNNISQANAAIINQWWQSSDLLKFYYDLINYPATYIIVRIINETQPLQMMMPMWRDKYEGLLILREI